MSYKTILVHLDAGKRCDTRSALAVRMALDFGAHLTALYAVSPPAIPGYVAVEFGEEFMQSYWRRQAEKGKDICKRFSDHAAKAGLPVAEARVSAEDPVEALQLHARYADLAVVGQHDPDDELAMVPASFPELAVLAAGRPVLLVPYAGTFPSIGERVLVAWSDTREAARAVTDALPLLQRAKKVMVFTVDAGHGQIEMDLLNHTSNHLDGVRTKEWGAAAFNVRLGLLNNFELGVFVSPYIHDTERPRCGPSESRTGFGDVTLRAKFNFFGNDGGGTALGLIADLKLPTAAQGLGSDAVEGAVFLPASFELGGGWDLGAMTGVDLRWRDIGGGRRGVWINTITTGHGITENLGGYVELNSETGDGAPVVTLDTGFALKLDARTQVDVGVQFGLSRTADDAVVFVGWARRY